MDFQSVLATIPPTVKLCAVSKTKPAEAILELYNAGQRVFGENKVQELCEKYEVLPKDIEWHQIGHLQTNKVKYMAPFVAMIHAVDSLKLLQEINKQAANNNRVIDCLLQFHIAQEETKFGMDRQEVGDLLSYISTNPLANIRLRGVMGMASFVEDQQQIRNEFSSLKGHFEWIKGTYKVTDNFDTISMGMSGDYQMAIEEGSNLVRLGSILFGTR